MIHTVIGAVTLVGVLAWSEIGDAQQALFIVRHGEDVRSGGAERPLTKAGRRRAMLLANILKDAGINAIFTSTLRRAIQTAEPFAKASKIEPTALEQITSRREMPDLRSFVELLRTHHADSIVLFVGHSNTVPALLKALGHPTEIKIPETEYDNLFVLFPKRERPPTVLRLRYN